MEIADLPKDKKIILFDGVCNLCESSVQFVIKKDKNDVFRFVAIQSEFGQKLIKYLGIDTSKTDSMILYEPGIAYYFKSEAVFRITKYLSGYYFIFSVFNLFPNGINDWFYEFVAKNRYKWYGKKEECMLPTKEILSKFL